MTSVAISLPTASSAEATAGTAPKGILALFAPKDPAVAAARAERRAARLAAREAQAQAAADVAVKPAAFAAPAAAAPAAEAAAEDQASRDKLKAAVANAIAHRPKGRLWCVPFARAVSGVEIRGNARTWWDQAKGVYARGHEPEVGAVMAFAASRAMPKGHVAVVSHVISDRQILIDQANWERNRITQDTLVVDVSAKGDWSRVKVANSSGTLGRVNPVNGFIYN